MRLDEPLVAFGVSLDRRLSSQPHNRPVTMWTEEMQDLDGASPAGPASSLQIPQKLSPVATAVADHGLHEHRERRRWR
ncbi:hypothetical protein DLJ61_00050 [Gordonia terrae]|uniref:Uncharacterized protein n=1 Tax=Gordonia terrae TaxID=2055 RepID=A0AAD0K355_9ACTN|nr:hypothetical protein BCM27_00050 [Gordonia terrae]AWO82169.1 hypothetical protein DLJ61_00050 [Gordonia terrae]